MRAFAPTRFFLLVLGPLAISFAGLAQEHDHDHGSGHLSETIEFLDVLLEVGRDGTVRTEQTFDLVVTGDSIERGPVLSYLTAYRGPGRLVLDNEMKVEEVLRNGKPEPFRVSSEDGQLTLVCGTHDTLLEKTTHRYQIRTVALGDWRHDQGTSMAGFDVLGPLRSFAIEKARVRLRLPDGVPIEKHAEVIQTSTGRLIPAEFSLTTTELVVSGLEPLEAGSFFFLNAVWPSNGFTSRSQWGQVVRQHPRLLLAGFVALVLGFLLVISVHHAVKQIHEIRLTRAEA